MNALNLSPFNPFVWNHWDTGHYLSIVRDGHTFVSCAEVDPNPKHAAFMCGNAGWFPAYSYLLKPFYPAFDLVLVASILSKVFFFSMLALVGVLFRVQKITLKNVLLILVASFWFGSYYYQGIFPVSMCLTFVLLAILFYKQQRFGLLLLATGLAAFSYATGFLLAVALGMAFLFNTALTKRERWQKAAMVNAAGAGAVLLFFFILWISVGDWQAFLKVQSIYGHGIESPIKRIGDRFSAMASPIFQIENAIYLQSFWVLIGYVTFLVLFITKKMWKNHINLLVFAYVSLYIIFPWTVGGTLSIYRAESLLLPGILLFDQLKTRYLLIFLTILILTWLPMSYLFLNSTLI